MVFDFLLISNIHFVIALIQQKVAHFLILFAQITVITKFFLPNYRSLTVKLRADDI